MLTVSAEQSRALDASELAPLEVDGAVAQPTRSEREESRAIVAAPLPTVTAEPFSFLTKDIRIPFIGHGYLSVTR